MKDERDPASGTQDELDQDGSATAPGTDEIALEVGSDEETEVERLTRELEDERRKRAQLLSERSKVEEERRRLNEERAQSTPPTYDPGQQQSQQNYRKIEAAIAQVRQYADAGDPHSILQLAQLEAQQRQMEKHERDRQQDINEAAFSRISDADSERGAREYFASGDYRTPAAALKAWKGDRAEREADTIAKKRREIEIEAKRREEGVVDRSVRSVGASEAKRRKEMTSSTYQATLDRLDSEGNHDERRKLVRARLDGSLKVDGSR